VNSIFIVLSVLLLLLTQLPLSLSGTIRHHLSADENNRNHKSSNFRFPLAPNLFIHEAPVSGLRQFDRGNKSALYCDSVLSLIITMQ
jgi:hypothetical protein